MITDPPAIHDIWILVDNFVKEAFATLEAMKLQAWKDAQISPLFIHNFYSIIPVENLAAGGVKYATARIVNSLIKAINTKNKLPKYLLVMPDKDMYST